MRWSGSTSPGRTFTFSRLLLQRDIWSWYSKKASLKVKPFDFERCFTRTSIDSMVFLKSADWKSTSCTITTRESMIFQRANLESEHRHKNLAHLSSLKCLPSPNVWRQIEIGSCRHQKASTDARKFKVTPQLECFITCSANTDKTTAAVKAQHKYLRCDNSNSLIALSFPSFLLLLSL